MPNSDTAHSRQLRKETAAKRRQRIIDEGGRDLRILLEQEETRMLAQLQQASGRPGQPETATAVIKQLIQKAHGKINQKCLPPE